MPLGVQISDAVSTRRRFEAAAHFRTRRAKAASEAFYRIVGAGVPAVLDEILIDRDGVAAFRDFRFDPRGVNTDTATPRSQGHFGGGCDLGGRYEVGGHFGEGVRFCRRSTGLQEARFLADPPDRFVPMTSLAANAPDAPA